MSYHRTTDNRRKEQFTEELGRAPTAKLDSRIKAKIGAIRTFARFNKNGMSLMGKSESIPANQVAPGPDPAVLDQARENSLLHTASAESES